jgi:predicted DNA-binding transcriptional regulator YafY
VLAAWCELRDAIRHFRVDRIVQAELSGERYAAPRHALLRQWRAENDIEEHY